MLRAAVALSKSQRVNELVNFIAGNTSWWCQSNLDLTSYHIIMMIIIIIIGIIGKTITQLQIFPSVWNESMFLKQQSEQMWTES